LVNDTNLPLFAQRIDVAQPKRRTKPERLFLQLMKAWLEANNMEPNGKNNALAAKAVQDELKSLREKTDQMVPNIGVSSASADGTIASKPLTIQ